MVHRRAVPPRAKVTAVRAAPAVRQLHRRRQGAEPAGVSRAFARKSGDEVRIDRRRRCCDERGLSPARGRRWREAPDGGESRLVLTRKGVRKNARLTTAYALSRRREKGQVGRMAEWFKAAVLKTAVGATPP